MRLRTRPDRVSSSGSRIVFIPRRYRARLEKVNEINPDGLYDRHSANGIVWAATLPDDGPQGAFLRDRKSIQW